MRCSNCGWTNPDGITKCQKCNQSLLAETIQMSMLSEQQSNSDVQSCPKCGYPISKEINICPICKTQLNDSGNVDTPVVQLRKTVAQSDLNDSYKSVANEMASSSKDAKSESIESNTQDSEEKLSSSSQNDKNKNELKKTVLDFIETSDSIADEMSGNESDDKVNDAEAENKQWRYEFECLDTQEHNLIEIVSEDEMFFSDNEIILISGLRFKIRKRLDI